MNLDWLISYIKQMGILCSNRPALILPYFLLHRYLRINKNLISIHIYIQCTFTFAEHLYSTVHSHQRLLNRQQCRRKFSNLLLHHIGSFSFIERSSMGFFVGATLPTKLAVFVVRSWQFCSRSLDFVRDT
ncbi:unnamed protein product [Ceratitis capitata]|uniref:(Mediterranean fruit fly) hypothetical protein n=1 Tax=Ceratitis capitata TaxID=7213 RepID=A0A811UMW4_CERCA|nr:unnamed protein product [Ceratitis capitata]